MAYMKLVSKSEAFQWHGQSWLCTTGLPSDVTIEIGDLSFHLHKFPLLLKSGVLAKLIDENSDDKEGCTVKLHNFPGGAKTFELVTKFCYGVKFELTASNVIYLSCAAEHLQMTEEISENNLIDQTENFLNTVILHHWKDSIKALQTCDDLLPYAENLQIVKRCIDYLVLKICRDQNLFGWPIVESGAMQTPGGSVLWNGISAVSLTHSFSSDWWYEDISSLSLCLFKRLVSTLKSQDIRQEAIAGSVTYYAKRYLPGLERHRSSAHARMTDVSTEETQKHLVEEITTLLPFGRGVASTKILFGLLRTAMILKAGASCISDLEKRIGMQLDQATLEDLLLLPNVSHSIDTLYNVDCVQRLLENFLLMDQVTTGITPSSVNDDQVICSPSLVPITTVAKLIDGYLAEVAPDINLKLTKFKGLAAGVPYYARQLDDGLYRAIDIYLKAHPLLTEHERDKLCRLMDYQKLSREACTHAAQNERLPLRVIIQILFFEQLQLRASIAGCLLVPDNLNVSQPITSNVAGLGDANGQVTFARENQVMKVSMDDMIMRVSKLEKECSDMKLEIENLGQGKTGWVNALKIFRYNKIKSQMCSEQEGSVSEQDKNKNTIEKLLAKLTKHKKQLSKYA